MKLTLQNYVDFLFHHAQENTSVDNPWITIKTRDVPEITGCSNHYVRRVLDGLKNHPRIILFVRRIPLALAMGRKPHFLQSDIIQSYKQTTVFR